MSLEPADVSVVIPTFDRSALLQRALDSIVAQSIQPLEVIVVDDGSSDDTEEVVQRHALAVRYLPQDHRGVSAARNRGVAAASSRWVAFLDSDDEWLPAKLEQQLEALERQPGHRICHTDEIWIRNGRRVNPRHHHRKHGGRIFVHCLPRCAISPSSVLLERSLLEELGGFDERLPACEDYDLWLRLCARYPVLLVERRLIVKYGGHRDQLSRRYWGLDRFRIYALEKILAEGSLSEDELQATLSTLLQKIEIYVGGLEKRGREAEVEILRARHRQLQAGPSCFDTEELGRVAQTLLAAAGEAT